MKIPVINIEEKFSKVNEFYSYKVIAQMNDYHFKIVKANSELVWHSHPETDEVFIVLEGELHIMLRDTTLVLRDGEMVVIPKGIEHKPVAKSECKVMLIEPAGTPAKGDAEDSKKEEPQWI